MKTRRKFWGAVLTLALAAGSASASERYFGYTYEPETLPKGAAEFEQWVTLRALRKDKVGQDNFNRWELREEFEYGVTDRDTMAGLLERID